MLDEGGASPAPTEGRTAARQAREARCRACYRLRFGRSRALRPRARLRCRRHHAFVSPYRVHPHHPRKSWSAPAPARYHQGLLRELPPFYGATRRSRERAACTARTTAAAPLPDAEAAAEPRRASRRPTSRPRSEACNPCRQRAAAEAERARTRAEKQAYADKQAKKRAILKALREQPVATSLVASCRDCLSPTVCLSLSGKPDQWSMMR